MEMQLRIILLKTVNCNYTVHTSTSSCMDSVLSHILITISRQWNLLRTKFILKYHWQLIPTVLNLTKHRQKSAWHGPRVENVYKKSVTQDATLRTEKIKTTKARKNSIRKKKKLLTKQSSLKSCKFHAVLHKHTGFVGQSHRSRC